MPNGIFQIEIVRMEMQNFPNFPNFPKPKNKNYQISKIQANEYFYSKQIRGK